MHAARTTDVQCTSGGRQMTDHLEAVNDELAQIGWGEPRVFLEVLLFEDFGLTMNHG